MAADTALLVIDVQVGMFDESGPVYGADRLLQNINTLLDRARAAGTPVIYVQHNETEGPLQQGRPEWPIHPAIAPQPEETVIQKRYPDSFQETELQQVLSDRNIRKLVICGIQSEMCVDTTTRRAFSSGYEVTLASDAHGTWSNPHVTAEALIAHQNATLRWFADVKETEQIQF